MQAAAPRKLASKKCGTIVDTHLVDERGGYACFPAATGTSYPVNVVFDLAGHVEVYNVLNVGKVQSLSGDVGRNKYILRALLFTTKNIIVHKDKTLVVSQYIFNTDRANSFLTKPTGGFQSQKTKYIRSMYNHNEQS